jgi:hypothetical protein
MNIQSILKGLISSPKKLFLIDGLGACLTAFLLGGVLSRFEATFGMPRNILYFLSILACVFAAYSLACHFFVGKNWPPFLRAIAWANLLYCCLTFGLVVALYKSLSVLGIAYFLGELFVMGILIFIEFFAVSPKRLSF